MDSPRTDKKSSLKPFLLGVILGAAVMGGVMMWPTAKPTQAIPAAQAPVPRPAPCPEPQTAEATQPRKAGDFAFYDVLEKVPVAPSRPDLETPPLPPQQKPAGDAGATAPTAGGEVPPPKTTTISGPVYLQLASYKAEADAEALRARVALTGVAG